MGIDGNGLVIPHHHGTIIQAPHPTHPGFASIPGKRFWRKGKWTDEEEKYTKKLISAFSLGLLPLSPGTTLRCFLSEKLNW